MPSASRVQRMKARWGVTSNWAFAAILIVFSLAGMGITQVRRPLFHVLGFNEQTPTWLKVVAWLAFLFPL